MISLKRKLFPRVRTRDAGLVAVTGGRKRGQTTCVASVQFRLLRRARMSLDLAGYLSLAMANRFLGVQDPAMPPSDTFVHF